MRTIFLVFNAMTIAAMLAMSCAPQTGFLMGLAVAFGLMLIGAPLFYAIKSAFEMASFEISDAQLFNAIIALYATAAIILFAIALYAFVKNKPGVGIGYTIIVAWMVALPWAAINGLEVMAKNWHA
ncbi:MAG: hypothetical protein A4S12_11095 [Proteobacteria bacterium SG_bin5]|nr:hypothetical protein [Sphingomonas sp.]OQW39713.1 MAG: hypothetical protein A4S12_11095 [Proteobacteria bacterium SG_bin5]